MLLRAVQSGLCWGLCLLLLPLSLSLANDQIVLRAADTYPIDYPTTAGLFEMKRYLEEKTDGRIQMIIYPDAELGSEHEILDMVRIGVLDIARVSALDLAEFSAGMEAFCLPYLFRNEYHLWAVLESEVGQTPLVELLEHQIIGLCYYEAGVRGFYSIDRPIWRHEDLRQLKIRVPYSRIVRDMIESLGAIPTQMSLGEVYGALQLGVIDGAEASLPTYYIRRHYELAKNYTMDEHSRIPDVVIMSQEKWKELSARDQLLIQRAAKASTVYQRKLWYELEAKALEEVEARGVHVNYPTIELKELFLKAMQNVRKKYQKRNLEWMIRGIPDGEIGG